MSNGYPDINSLVSSGSRKYPYLISGGQESVSSDGVRRRIEVVENQERIQLMGALARPPAAPPPPTRISFDTPGIGAVKLTWKPVDDVRVYGYNIYGSSVNNPNTAPRVGFQAQVPDPRQGQVVYVDTITAGANAFYWVSAANRAGPESPRIPMHLGTPPATVSAGGARPVYEDDFPPTVIDDTDAGLILRLYSTWRWWDAGANPATLIGSQASSLGYPGSFIYQSAGINRVSVFRPYQLSSPNWFKNTDLFDSYFTTDVRWLATTTDLRIGYIGNSASTMPPANGIYFEKLAADTNWFLVTRAAGVETRVDTGVAVQNGFELWELFRLRRVNATTIGGKVGSGSEVTSTTNIPTANSANLDPFLAVVNGASAGASGTFDIDIWRIFFTGLGAKRPTV